jgi:hypothetical protein
MFLQKLNHTEKCQNTNAKLSIAKNTVQEKLKAKNGSQPASFQSCGFTGDIMESK